MFIKAANHPQELGLSSTNITSDGAKGLVPALRRNFKLRHLALSDNGIDDSGAGHLAKVVRTSHSLRSLDLSYNRIHAVGDRKLGKAAGRGNLAKMMARPNIDLSSNWGCFG